MRWNSQQNMTKYGEITDISVVNDTISIYREKRHLKRRYDKIKIISISAIYHDIFRYIHPSLLPIMDGHSYRVFGIRMFGWIRVKIRVSKVDVSFNLTLTCPCGLGTHWATLDHTPTPPPLCWWLLPLFLLILVSLFIRLSWLCSVHHFREQNVYITANDLKQSSFSNIIIK